MSEVNERPIIARRLSRAFDKRVAVRDVSFAVPRGKVLALVGRNGAGKTTTMRMLLGILAPSAGQAMLLGEPSRSLSPTTRARVGYMAEGNRLYEWMSVRELIAFQQTFYPRFDMPTCRAVVDAFRLEENQKVGSLSAGQRAGLNLALALAPQPEVLLLDDPVMGLDPVARRLLLEAMVHFTEQRECTTVFSSHVLSDIERVSDAVAILERGELRACCSVDHFCEHIRQYALSFEGSAPTISDVPGLLSTKRLEREIRVTVSSDNDDTLQRLSAMGPVERLPLSFEDAALAYLGERSDVQFSLPTEGS